MWHNMVQCGCHMATHRWHLISLGFLDVAANLPVAAGEKKSYPARIRT